MMVHAWLPGCMYHKIDCPGIPDIDCRSINGTFLVVRAFYLSTGVRYVCVRCLYAGNGPGNWAHVDGGTAERIW